MTNVDRVKEWLQNHSQIAYCDACVAKSLELKGRRAAWRVSKMISSETEFHREIGICPMCDEKRLLIRRIFPGVRD